MFRRTAVKLYRSPILNHIKQTQDQKVHTNLLKHHSCTNCRYLTSKIPHFNQNITNKLAEDEYLVKIRDDPDTFGIPSIREEEYDRGDVKEDEYLENSPDPSKKLRTKQYADMIKALIQKRKIKEAIDIVEIRMLKDDRVKPESYIYNLLLGACGKVGYTKKAFALYNRMKQRGLKATGGTYTALFNACANSPWREDGLSRARHLREIMMETAIEANDSTYNAMIKAFGRCGDLETAFSLVDEMQKIKLPLKADTLNFLLQACITDTDAGFRHSLLVWRKFIEKNVKPDIYSYNLLLRSVRDCSLGNVATTKDVLDNIMVNNNLLLESAKNENEENQIEEIGKEVILSENRPNLIAKVPHLGNVLSISEITKCEDRLLLIGGCSGFLKNMEENRCVPNIKTYTQLLDSIPSTLSAEKELIVSMKRNNLKPDVDFYNMLIKKRSMRFDYELAKEVLTRMRNAKLRPNIITFGVLALGCQTKEEAESLIAEMHNENYRLNAEILGAMLHQACFHCNFPYILKIMEICRDDEIRPNKKFMECLEEFKKKCKKMSNDNDCNKAKSKGFQKGYKVFSLRYKSWRGEVDPINEDETHPWQQFRQDVETNVKHYKDKDMSSRFKPRRTSLYRQKKNQIIREKKDKSGSGPKIRDSLNVHDIKQINTI